MLLINIRILGQIVVFDYANASGNTTRTLVEANEIANKLGCHDIELLTSAVRCGLDDNLIHINDDNEIDITLGNEAVEYIKEINRRVDLELVKLKKGE